MVRNIRLCLAAICLPMASAVIPPAAFAGENMQYPLNPASQPLLVVRTDKPSRFQELWNTRLARTLELGEKDFSGRLPGVNVKVASLKNFLAALSENNAEKFWYCLVQSGSSIAGQTGAMGWTLAAQSSEEAESIFASLNMDASKRHVAFKTTPGKETRVAVTISRDTAAYDEILRQATRSNERWRATLDSFLAEDGDGVGLLINARPLFGLLSMAIGIDFRSELSRARFSFPESIHVELRNNRDDLGIVLQCPSLFPGDTLPPAPQPQTILTTREAPLLALHIAAPEQLCALLRLDKLPVYLANINMQPLVPKTATLSLWLNERGELAWSLVGLMADGEKFSRQFRRVLEWLDVLDTAPSAKVRRTTTHSKSGEELVAVAHDAFSLVMGTAHAPDGGAFWIVAGSADDWPDAATFETRRENEASLIAFAARLAPEDRGIILSALAKRARQMGVRLPDDPELELLLPERDEGLLRIEGGSLRFESRHCLLPLLVPALAERLPF